MLAYLIPWHGGTHFDGGCEPASQSRDLIILGAVADDAQRDLGAALPGDARGLHRAADPLSTAHRPQVQHVEGAVRWPSADAVPIWGHVTAGVTDCDYLAQPSGAQDPREGVRRRHHGSGFSLQLGAIAEVATGVRIGLTYTSPTWYTLQDELSQSLSATTLSNGTYFANPNVVAVYEKYSFRTPGAWTVGASWVWNKQLILSADYMYRGFGNMRFTSDDLLSENAIVQNSLGDTNALRFGAEYRLPMSKTNHLFLRGGGRYEQSPYKTDYKPISRLKSLSAGVGVSFSGVRVDLSYDIARRYYQPQLYETVLTDTPMVKNTTHNILLSFSMKL